MSETSADSSSAADSFAKLSLILIFTAILAFLVFNHVTGINGASYHLWAWRRSEPLRYFPGLLLAAAPFVLAQMLSSRKSMAIPIGLLMLSMFFMQLVATGLQLTPFSLWRVAEVVQQPYTTSYYTDAQYLATQRSFAGFLREYPNLMQYFNLHSREKPPGLILYYYSLFKLVSDPDTIAIVGGILIGAIATLVIPATFFLVRWIAADRVAAFAAASYLALCPSMIVFFPMFDIVYPALTCAILGFWFQSLQTRKAGWALAMGGALSATIFMAFNLLILGAAVVIIAAWHLRSHGRSSLRTIAKMSVISLLVVITVYGILYLATGFNEIATFAAAMRNQDLLNSAFYFQRPYPQTIPSDVQDFLLASGWISLPLVVFYLLRRRIHPIAVIAVVQIAIAAISGLLRCETARIWIFMLPLIALPIGLELSHWPRGARMGIYACLWLLTVAIAQNMKFLLG